MLKYLSWRIVYCCLISSGCLFVKGVYAEVSFDKVQFEYSKNNVVLTKYDDDFLIDNEGNKYTYNKKIIIQSLLSVEDVLSIHGQINEVQIIANIGKEPVYWVTPNEGRFFEVYTMLKEHKGVLAIEPDIAPVRKLISSSKKQLQIDSSAIELQKLSLCKHPVNRVRVAIIDDGFDFTHPEFDKLKVLLEYDADQKVMTARAKAPIDFHGTLVAGVIAAKRDNRGIEGLAPTSEIIAIRQVSTWTSSLILAFQVAKMMNADVVNCSWVVSFLSDITAQVIEDFSALPNNPIIVAAAGNSGKKACEINKLSKLATTVTVGSINNGERAKFSNYGKCVDYYVPSSIESTSLNGYAHFGGTSSSAAMFSGIVAQLKACGIEYSLANLSMIENIYPAHTVEKK
ncbi:S8/S53 family peptidase [Pseudoalteromonas sp. MMG005]|nr:S8/S53 family peptidase [Pseudoalteromonas sp. MMG005]